MRTPRWPLSSQRHRSVSHIHTPQTPRPLPTSPRLPSRPPSVPISRGRCRGHARRCAICKRRDRNQRWPQRHHCHQQLQQRHHRHRADSRAARRCRGRAQRSSHRTGRRCVRCPNIQGPRREAHRAVRLERRLRLIRRPRPLPLLLLICRPRRFRDRGRGRAPPTSARGVDSQRKDTYVLPFQHPTLIQPSDLIRTLLFFPLPLLLHLLRLRLLRPHSIPRACRREWGLDRTSATPTASSATRQSTQERRYTQRVRILEEVGSVLLQTRHGRDTTRVFRWRVGRDR